MTFLCCNGEDCFLFGVDDNLVKLLKRAYLNWVEQNLIYVSLFSFLIFCYVKVFVIVDQLLILAVSNNFTLVRCLKY